MAVLWHRADHYRYIFAPWFLLSSSFFLAYSQPSHIGWCDLSANLECRSEMCCTRLAGNTRRKQLPKIRHLGTVAQLCRAVSSQVASSTIPSSYIRVRAIVWTCGRGQTDTQTQTRVTSDVTTIHFASSTTHAKCNDVDCNI